MDLTGWTTLEGEDDLDARDDVASSSASRVTWGGIAILALGLGVSVAEGGVGIGLGMGVVGLALTAVGRRLSAPERLARQRSRRRARALLDVAAPLFILSSTTACRLRRLVEPGSATPTDLRARLVLQERVRSAGGGSRTTTHDVLEVPVPITPVRDPAGVIGELTISLPDHPPSFGSRHNGLWWLLLVDVELDDGSAETHAFDLPVGTAVWAEEE